MGGHKDLQSGPQCSDSVFVDQHALLRGCESAACRANVQLLVCATSLENNPIFEVGVVISSILNTMATVERKVMAGTLVSRH